MTNRTPASWTALEVVLIAVAALVMGSWNAEAAHSGQKGKLARSSAEIAATSRSDWPLNGGMEHMDMAPSGVLYFTGWFTKIGTGLGSQNVARRGAAALDTRSGIITSWNPRPNGTARGLAVSPGGKIVYVVGDFTRIGGQKRIRIAALDARTGVATNWRPVRVGIYSDDDVAVAPDESRVYVAGGSGIFALDARTGRLVWRSRNPYCCGNALSLSPDGATVYGEGYQKGVAGGSSRGVIVALRARDGRMRWKTYDYAAPLIGTTLISGNGRTLFVGDGDTFVALDGATGKARARPLRVTGHWGTDNDDPTVDALALVEDSRVVYVAGNFWRMGGRPHKAIAAIDTRSGRVLDWDPGAHKSIGAIAVTPDDKRVFFGDWITRDVLRSARATHG